MIPLVLLLFSLLFSSLLAYLALKIPVFGRRKVILKTFFISLLVIFLTPFSFFLGSRVALSFGRNSLTWESFVNQCNRALHQCITFSSATHRSDFGLFLLIFLLFTGVVIVSLRRALLYWKGYRLLKSSHPVRLSGFPKLRAALVEAKRRAQCEREIPLYLVKAEGPQIGIFGVRKPRILFSQALVDALEEEELVAVLLHEIGHLRFKDNLWSLVLGAFRDLFFFLLPLQSLHRAYEEEKEYAADRWAKNLLGDPLPLAYALVKVSGGIESGRITSALSLEGENSHLRRRIRNLLGEEGKPVKNRRVTRGFVLALLLFLLTSFSLGALEGKRSIEVKEMMKCSVSEEVLLSEVESSCACSHCTIEGTSSQER